MMAFQHTESDVVEGVYIVEAAEVVESVGTVEGVDIVAPVMEDDSVHLGCKSER